MRNNVEYTLLDEQASTWVGKAILVDDFQHVALSFATDWGWTAALTVKIQWSIQEDKPDFSLAQSVSNHWDYIEVIDYEDGTAIDWDLWISVATADDYKTLIANIDLLRWMSVEVTARTAWSVTVKAILATNH